MAKHSKHIVVLTIESGTLILKYARYVTSHGQETEFYVDAKKAFRSAHPAHEIDRNVLSFPKKASDVPDTAQWI